MNINYNKKKLVIGLVVYKAAKYLPYFLESLEKQNNQNFDLYVASNHETEKNEDVGIIKNIYPGAKIEWMGANIGFGNAYNKLIEKADRAGAEYFMVTNPDTKLENDAVGKMIGFLDNDKTLGSVCPKILSWDFENDKVTNLIDSCGLVMNKALRFTDLGQGEVDNKQYNNADIIGPSGACGIFRISALNTIKDEYGYFDKRMFMYKEDCDLAYRLHINGFKSRCVSESIVYHDRTAKANGQSIVQIIQNRKNKSKQIKKWSFINQQIIFCKHWKSQSFNSKFSIFYFQIKTLIYILFFEQYLLVELFKQRKILKKLP